MQASEKPKGKASTIQSVNNSKFFSLNGDAVSGVSYRNSTTCLSGNEIEPTGNKSPKYTSSDKVSGDSSPIEPCVRKVEPCGHQTSSQSLPFSKSRHDESFENASSYDQIMYLMSPEREASLKQMFGRDVRLKPMPQS